VWDILEDTAVYPKCTAFFVIYKTKIFLSPIKKINRKKFFVNSKIPKMPPPAGGGVGKKRVLIFFQRS